MKNNFIILIAAISLSLSMIFSALYIGNALSIKAPVAVSQGILMNSEQAAEYLGISVETFISIIKKDNLEKQNLSSYPTYKFVPYIAIDGVKYFSRIELLKWVEYNTYNR